MKLMEILTCFSCQLFAIPPIKYLFYKVAKRGILQSRKETLGRASVVNCDLSSKPLKPFSSFWCLFWRELLIHRVNCLISFSKLVCSILFSLESSLRIILVYFELGMFGCLVLIIFAVIEEGWLRSPPGLEAGPEVVVLDKGCSFLSWFIHLLYY